MIYETIAITLSVIGGCATWYSLARMHSRYVVMTAELVSMKESVTTLHTNQTTIVDDLRRVIQRLNTMEKTLTSYGAVISNLKRDVRHLNSSIEKLK